MPDQYFYVKNNFGTRTSGGGTTKQTGSFASLGASNVYATVKHADSDGADSGDFILASEYHKDSVTVNGTWNVDGSVSAINPMYIMSVADSACDQFRPGAEAVGAAGSSDVRVYGKINLYGWKFNPPDLFQCFGGLDTESRFYECTFQFATGNYFAAVADGDFVELYDCHWIWEATDAAMFTNVRGMGRQIGGTSESLAGGDGFVNRFSATNSYTNSGVWREIHAYDLDIVDGYITSEGSSVAVDDAAIIRIHGCKLHADVSFSQETIAGADVDYLVTNSAATDSEGEYQYAYLSGGGRVDDDTSIYRNESFAYPSGERISLKCVTNTTTGPNHGRPFEFVFPKKYANLSNTNSDLIRIHMLCDSDLTDADVWAEAIYQDVTTFNQYNSVLSVSDAFLPLRTISTLDSSSKSWTGRTTEKAYQIDLDTSVDSGNEGLPFIRMFVGKPTATIYFDPTVELL